VFRSQEIRGIKFDYLPAEIRYLLAPKIKAVVNGVLHQRLILEAGPRLIAAAM